MLPQDRVNKPRQEIMRYVRAGIGPHPKLACLLGLVRVPCDHHMEGRRDVVLFRLTRSVAQFVSLSGVIGSHPGFTNIPIHAANKCVGKCKIRVELDCTLKKWNSCGRTGCVQNFLARAESFKCVERGRGGLFKWSIESSYSA